MRTNRPKRLNSAAAKSDLEQGSRNISRFDEQDSARFQAKRQQQIQSIQITRRQQVSVRQFVLSLTGFSFEAAQ